MNFIHTHIYKLFNAYKQNVLLILIKVSRRQENLFLIKREIKIKTKRKKNTLTHLQ